MYVIDIDYREGRGIVTNVIVARTILSADVSQKDIMTGIIIG